MIRFLALFLCTLPLFAEGGIQDVPPWPTEYGTEIVTDGDLESVTNWTVGACAAPSAGNGVGGSDAVEITGPSSGQCFALQQSALQMPDPYVSPLVHVCVQLRKTVGADGAVFVSWRDSAHGTYHAPRVSANNMAPANGATERSSDFVVGGGDFLEICEYMAISPNHHAENWRLDIIGEAVTTGTWYIDDITVKPAWYPLYNFVKYPNHKGYLWSGHASHLCGTPAADCIAGFADVRPPSGLTLADVYVNEKLDTTAGCPSPIETQRYDPATRRVDWQLDGSAIAVDGRYYVCAEVRQDSDDSLIADFPDWKIIKRTVAWRTTNLQHWIDDYGRWVDGVTPRFMWMAYQRFSGENCSACVWAANLDGRTKYQNDIKGFDRRKTIWADYLRSARNVTNYFSPGSAMNPTAGSTTDTFTPWLEALDDMGLRAFQIMSSLSGTLLGRDETESADELAGIRAVAKELDNGDQWIFATNLCPDSQTMTFSLADATGKIATDYFTGASYTITDGDLDVASTDFGVHVIKVETPKGGSIRGR